jgi:hypothetical protein
MAAMWPHFLNLVRETWHAFLQAEGTTGLGWIGDKIVLPCAAFAFAVIVIWSAQGMEAVKEHKNRTLGIAFAASLGAFIIWHISVFFWIGIKTVYGNHHDGTGRWVAVVNEKNALKGWLADRDKYIKGLQQQIASKPTVVEKTKFAPEPKRCWTDDIGPLRTPDGKGLTLVGIHCNYRAEAPLRVTVELNRPLADVQFTIPSRGVSSMSGLVTGWDPGKGGMGAVFHADLQSPSIPAGQLVIVQAKSLTVDAPISIEGTGSITSK